MVPMKGKDTPINTPPEEDIELFREAMRDVRRLPQDTITPTRKRTLRKVATPPAAHNEHEKRQQSEFFFSDSYYAHFSDQEKPTFLRDGTPPHWLKILKRGQLEPEWYLDLHGMTQQQAKSELAALLSHAHRHQAICVSVMHGIGKRILKQQLPHWLAQHPYVRAFHQAPRQWGGHAAILVLLDGEHITAHQFSS